MHCRSIIEPIRNKGFRDPTHFHYSSAVQVDLNNRTVTCISASKGDRKPYVLNYDHLVIGVGSLSNTFNIPGVNEHTVFLKVRKIFNLSKMIIFS